MTAVTREDREAAATVTLDDRTSALVSVYGSKTEHVPSGGLWWATHGDSSELLTHDAIGHDKCIRRAREFAAHREASTQALREAAERLANVVEDVLENELPKRVLGEAIDALRSALSPSPAQGGAAVPVVIGVGDEVQCTGHRLSNPPNTYCAHGIVRGLGGSADVRVDFGKRYGGEWLVHPRDLVLVRKATVK